MVATAGLALHLDTNVRVELVCPGRIASDERPGGTGDVRSRRPDPWLGCRGGPCHPTIPRKQMYVAVVSLFGTTAKGQRLAEDLSSLTDRSA